LTIGGWLLDDAFIRIINGQFSDINGLEAPNYFKAQLPCLENPTNDFIPILHSEEPLFLEGKI